jgi:hypothetical protein
MTPIETVNARNASLKILIMDHTKRLEMSKEPTEAMLEVVRSFIASTEMHPRTIEGARKHVINCGDSIEHWPEWAKTFKGHLTKAAIAEIIWCVMYAEANREESKHATSD